MPEGRGRLLEGAGRRASPRVPRRFQVELIVAATEGQVHPPLIPEQADVLAQVHYCHDAKEVDERLIACEPAADALLLWYPDAVWPPARTRRILAAALTPVYLAVPSIPRVGEWGGEARIITHDDGLRGAYAQLLSELGLAPERELKVVDRAPGVVPPVRIQRLRFPAAGPPDALLEEEAALLRAAKFSALRDSTAGLAHEMNNLVTPIAGYAQLLRAHAPDPHVGERLDIIESSAFRASELIDDLLTFVRTEVMNPEPVDPSAWLAELLAELAPLAAERGVRLSSTAPTNPPLVPLDRQRLAKALENVLWNAVQAIDEAGVGGRIEVEASILRLDEQSYRRFGMRALDDGLHVGDRVLAIEISDDGPGVSVEMIDRVFFPFMTTRGPDRGRGLGLSVTHGIIRSHGGAVTLVSPPKGGTRVSIVLPAPEAKLDAS